MITDLIRVDTIPDRVITTLRNTKVID